MKYSHMESEDMEFQWYLQTIEVACNTLGYPQKQTSKQNTYI